MLRWGGVPRGLMMSTGVPPGRWWAIHGVIHGCYLNGLGLNLTLEECVGQWRDRE